jgi:hypothetical protein
MKVYIICDNEGKVLHVGTTHIGEISIEVEVPDHDIFERPGAYSYDGINVIFNQEY